MSTIAIQPSFTARPTRPVGAGQVRLTRRGRLAIFALALLVAFGIAFALSDRSTATAEGGGEVPTETIVVEPGQTLWQIAAEHADDGDVRSMVDHIERVNALETSMLYAGQVLHVPAD